MVRLLTAALAVVLTKTTRSYQFITNDTLPSDSLGSTCAASLIVDVACPRQVSFFPTNSFFPVESLEEACTDICSTALGQYESVVEGACGEDDVFPIGENRTAPASFVATLLRYHFNKTCIQDGERWCNDVAYQASGGNGSVQVLNASTLETQSPFPLPSSLAVYSTLNRISLNTDITALFGYREAGTH